MEIYIGKYNGFCAGVKRAVDTAERIGKEDVYILGELIHNVSVVKKIEDLGVKTIENVDDISSGTLIIRSHGAPKEIYDKLKTTDIKVVDCTCPFVKKAQDMAANLSRENYYVVLLGDKNHPEIKGILGHVINNKNVEVVVDESEAEKVLYHAKTALISQTTQRED